jgi:hypothetical protein
MNFAALAPILSIIVDSQVRLAIPSTVTSKKTYDLQYL